MLSSDHVQCTNRLVKWNPHWASLPKPHGKRNPRRPMGPRGSMRPASEQSPTAPGDRTDLERPGLFFSFFFFFLCGQAAGAGGWFDWSFNHLEKEVGPSTHRKICLDFGCLGGFPPRGNPPEKKKKIDFPKYRMVSSHVKTKRVVKTACVIPTIHTH